MNIINDGNPSSEYFDDLRNNFPVGIDQLHPIIVHDDGRWHFDPRDEWRWTKAAYKRIKAHGFDTTERDRQDQIDHLRQVASYSPDRALTKAEQLGADAVAAVQEAIGWNGGTEFVERARRIEPKSPETLRAKQPREYEPYKMRICEDSDQWNKRRKTLPEHKDAVELLNNNPELLKVGFERDAIAFLEQHGIERLCAMFVHRDLTGVDSVDWPKADQVSLIKSTSNIKATPFIWIDPDKIPPRQWLYDRRLIRKFTTATFAAGGVGKSILVLTEVLAMVTGKDLLKTGRMYWKPLTCWYYNLEDPVEETQRRIAAICKHYRITAEDIGDRLFIDSGREAVVKIAGEGQKGELVIHQPVIERLTSEIHANDVDVLVIDPFVSCHDVNENDNSKVDAVAKSWSGIADETNTAIELIHHVRKGGYGERTVDDGRGASALLNAVRGARVLNPMDEKQAEKWNVMNPRSYFSSDVGKANLAARDDSYVWYELESVDLGNKTAIHQADSVGVTVRWRPPSQSAVVSDAERDAIVAAIGDVPVHRYDTRAKMWVGRLMAEHLGWDDGDKQVKKDIAALVDAWIKSLILKKVYDMDEHRERREFVVRDLVINVTGAKD